MRVCIFTETYYPVIGGGETQAKLLAEALAADGHSVLILTRRSDAQLKKYERYGTVDVYRLNPVGEGQLKKWGLLCSGLIMLIRLHRKYDLIFVSGFRIIGISAVITSKLFQKKCVLKADSQGEMSGSFFANGLRRYKLTTGWMPFRLFLGIRNWVLSKAEAFSAISSEITTEFTAAGILSDKVYLIPNTVDMHRFFPVTAEIKKGLRLKLGLPPDAIIVIYTGRLVSYKGLPSLLKAWREISRTYSYACLLLVGTGGLDLHNCETELRSYVSENKLENSVIFTGSVHNVPEYLQASDIFVFPTEDDALPSSLIEAMACGIPVITTPVGAIKTIIHDRQNGILIQPGNHQHLQQAFEELVTDRSLTAQLVHSALRTVQATYSAEVVVRQYISLFERILGVSAEALPMPNHEN